MSTWNRYLPSGQFIGVATPIVIGLVITFGLIYFSYPDLSGNAHTVEEERTNLLAVATEALMREQFTDVDSDKDGLLDWEEHLWGTDPNNPDSSGDGMQDGEAVRQGRDPLVAGPDNLLIHTRGINPKNGDTSTSSIQDLDRTERLAHQFLGSYLAMKQSGQSVSSADQERLVKNLARTSSVDFALETYSVSTFTILESVSEVERMAYYNAMKPIYDDLAQTEEDDLVLLYRARGGDAGNPMDAYERNLARYQHSVEALLSMPVPFEARLEHVALANTLANYHEILVLLKDPEADPVTSLFALQQFESVLRQVGITAEAMRAYFARQGYSL